jgi:hypothetical protein
MDMARLGTATSSEGVRCTFAGFHEMGIEDAPAPPAVQGRWSAVRAPRPWPWRCLVSWLSFGGIRPPGGPAWGAPRGAVCVFERNQSAYECLYLALYKIIIIIDHHHRPLNPTQHHLSILHLHTSSGVPPRPVSGVVPSDMVRLCAGSSVARERVVRGAAPLCSRRHSTGSVKHWW